MLEHRLAQYYHSLRSQSVRARERASKQYSRLLAQMDPDYKGMFAAYYMEEHEKELQLDPEKLAAEFKATTAEPTPMRQEQQQHQQRQTARDKPPPMDLLQALGILNMKKEELTAEKLEEVSLQFLLALGCSRALVTDMGVLVGVVQNFKSVSLATRHSPFLSEKATSAHTVLTAQLASEAQHTP